MTSSYVLTNRAVEDLAEIWNYTYEVWSEDQANKYYEYLIEMCCEIAINPSLGRSYNEVKDEILGFRMNQHIIFYRLINSDVIEVIRILHGKMDLKSRLDL